MVFAIILGIVLGAVTVAFALQNMAEVTVALFAWQFTGSLALVLLATLAMGILISLLLVLPESIKKYFQYRKLKKANDALAEELRKQKELTAAALKSSAISQTAPRVDQASLSATL